jgi:chitodextrinase
MCLKKIASIVLVSLYVLVGCQGATSTGSDTSSVSNVEITTSPGNNQKSIPVNLDTITVYFSDPINSATFTTGSISISPAIAFSIDTSLLDTTRVALITLDASLAANTDYTVHIEGIVDANGIAVPAQSWTFTTTTLQDTAPPSAPQNLRTTSVSSSQVSLAWNASQDDQSLAGYRVYRDNTLVTTTSQTSYTNSALSSNTTYQYRVEAYDAAGNSATSTTLSVTTSANTSDTTAPSVPTGLAITSNTSSSVSISWNASTDNVGVARYYIYRNTTQIGNTTSRNYTDSTVSASTTYQYRVAAADAAGNLSAQSTALSVTTSSGNYGVPYTDANFDAIMGVNRIYMSPNGTDSGNCPQSAPCRTFEYAVGRMQAGDGLILLDGNYSLAVNGGLRSTTENGTSIARSAQLQSGVDEAHPTIVRALNPGNVFIEGGFTLGNRTQKVQYVVIYGLTFFTPGNFRNVDYSVIKATGVYGRLSVGSIDHSMGCSYNLVEDVWIWGKNERGNAVNYSAHHNIWRRVLIRDDGCDTLYCGEGAGNLKISSTIYNSHDVTFENMISMDKILRANTYNTGSYSDFATAQHDSYRATLPPEGEQNGRNSWLGAMAINSEDYAINFEAGSILPLPETTGTIRDFVALNTRAGATIDGAGCPYNSASKYDINNVYLYSVAGNDIYSGCESNYVLGNNINTGSYTNNMATGRVPQYRYGTTTALWPWPYELRIRNDICVRGNFANTGEEFPATGIRAVKSFCTSGLSLSDYIASF